LVTAVYPAHFKHSAKIYNVRRPTDAERAQGIRNHLKEAGIAFPDGSDIFVDSDSAAIVHRNTPRNIKAALDVLGPWVPGQIRCTFLLRDPNPENAYGEKLPMSIGLIGRSGVQVSNTFVSKSGDQRVDGNVSMTATLGMHSNIIDLTLVFTAKRSEELDDGKVEVLEEYELVTSIALADATPLAIPILSQDGSVKKELVISPRVLDLRGQPLRPEKALITSGSTVDSSPLRGPESQ
jgi:hypothetical protein